MNIYIFVVSIPNENINEFKMAFKKYLCWSFNLSNDTIISYMAGLKRVWILEARGLFLERSGNVSGPKANFPIKTC